LSTSSLIALPFDDVVKVSLNKPQEEPIKRNLTVALVTEEVAEFHYGAIHGDPLKVTSEHI
jgi:hypothetical protein